MKVLKCFDVFFPGMYTALPLHANVGMAEAVLLFPTLTVQDMSCVIIELASRNSYSGIVDVSIDSYNDPATNYRNFSFLNEPKFGVPIELSPGVHRLTLKVGVETGTGIDLFSVMISSECPTMPGKGYSVIYQSDIPLKTVFNCEC